MTPEWPWIRISETATGKVIAVMPQGTIMTNPHWLEEMYGLTYEDVTVDITNNQQETTT